MSKPQINVSCPSTGRMWLIAGCAFFCVLQSALSDGGQSLAIGFAALISAILAEALLTYKRYGLRKIMDGSAAATAMLLTILLPNLINPVYAALGVIFAIVVVKYSFGGLGSNWLNPALGGWLFIRISWSSAFTNAFEQTTHSITEMEIGAASALDGSVTAFLNNIIFSPAGSQMPSGYIDLLFSHAPGLIVDRGLFALLIGTIVITAFGINRGWVPLVFISVYGFLIRFAGNLHEGFWSGDMLYGLFSGGTIAAAFILAAEPASSAKLKTGVLFSVILAAFFSWLFRYRALEYSGVIFAIALVNCLTLLIRFFEDRILLSRSSRNIIPESRL